MDINKSFNVPKRLHTPEYLVEQANSFANTLAAGRWNSHSIQEVGRISKIIEIIGDEFEMDEHYGSEVINTVTLSFAGMKEFVHTENEYLEVPAYVLTSTTGQEITKDEIPENVLKEIIEEAHIEEHPLHKLLNKDDPQMSDLYLDTFDDFTIERIQQALYTIDHKGEFEDYVLRYFYTIDGENVYEVFYTHSKSEITSIPTMLADGSEGEEKPISLDLLDEDTLEAEVLNIDVSHEKLLDSRDIRELNEFSELPKQEHIRRVLGMISLISSGQVEPRKRPQA